MTSLNFPFVKCHGAGNDFVLMDFCDHIPCVDFSALARSVCDRRYGIGADGLLLLLPSTIADFRMRIFNADGSEPAMCGNGIRCLAGYVLKSRSSLPVIAIETRSGVLKCRKLENQIAVGMRQPTKLHWPIQLERHRVYVVDTGVPHAVIFVDALDQIDVIEKGRWLRFHPQFAPEGLNVNFVTTMREGCILLRTYERGVEAETLSCGTGAAAAAFVVREVANWAVPICVSTRYSFEPSQAGYRQTSRFFFSDEIEMVGCATEVFSGAIQVDTAHPQ